MANFHYPRQAARMVPVVFHAASLEVLSSLSRLTENCTEDGPPECICGQLLPLPSQ